MNEDLTGNTPMTPPEDNITPDNQESWWQKLKEDKKLLYTSLGVVFSVIAGLGAAYYFIFGRSTPPPAPPEVVMVVSSPSRVISGQDLVMQIDYSNRSPHSLKDVQMGVIYPQDFRFDESDPKPDNQTGTSFSLADLGGGSTGRVKIKGVPSGKIGDKRQFQFQLRYKIKGFSTVYQTEQKAEVSIGTPDLTLSLTGPNEITAGQEAIYNITYRNIGGKALRGVVLDFTAASDFQVTSSVPELNENNAWSLGDLSPGKEESLKVAGVYTAASEQLEKIVEVVARESGSDLIIGRSFTVTYVKTSPVILKHELDDEDKIVLPGDTLQYDLEIVNTGSVTLTNLVVSTKLVGNAYDLSTLDTEGGVLSNQTVTWTPGGVSSLKLMRPNTRVSIRYSIQLHDPASRFNEKSMTVRSLPQVTSFELPEPFLGEEIEARVKTQTDLIQTVAYEGGSQSLTVGAETRFKVTWRLTNTTNTVSGAKITADLPLGPGSLVDFDSSAGTEIRKHEFLSSTIIWDVKVLEPHSEKTASLVVSVTPSVADANKTIVLLDNINFQGTDSFADQPVYDETPVESARAPGNVQR